MCRRSDRNASGQSHHLLLIRCSLHVYKAHTASSRNPPPQLRVQLSQTSHPSHPRSPTHPPQPNHFRHIPVQHRPKRILHPSQVQRTRQHQQHLCYPRLHSSGVARRNDPANHNAPVHRLRVVQTHARNNPHTAHRSVLTASQPHHVAHAHSLCAHHPPVCSQVVPRTQLDRPPAGLDPHKLGRGVRVTMGEAKHVAVCVCRGEYRVADLQLVHVLGVSVAELDGCMRREALACDLYSVLDDGRQCG
mmetsp:Transcript_10514/g.32169  ORF Transcript_10514/g.32169 Transcript_10514/m.32169 type:complete len:247 (-) Transcript_10514:458-1198(-)